MSEGQCVTLSSVPWGCGGRGSLGPAFESRVVDLNRYPQVFLEARAIILDLTTLPNSLYKNHYTK